MNQNVDIIYATITYVRLVQIRMLRDPRLCIIQVHLNLVSQVTVIVILQVFYYSSITYVGHSL